MLLAAAGHWEDALELGRVDGFDFYQPAGDGIQLVAVLHQHRFGLSVSFVDQPAHLTVDLLGDRFGIIALFGDFAAEEDQLFLLAVNHWAEGFGSCPGG